MRCDIFNVGDNLSISSVAVADIDNKAESSEKINSLERNNTIDQFTTGGKE